MVAEQIVSTFMNMGMVAELAGNSVTVKRPDKFKMPTLKFCSILFPQALTIIETRFGLVVEEGVGDQNVFSVFKDGIETGKIICNKE